jgi:regulator of replication initiation timing
MTAFGLGVVLFAKSEWNLQAWRSANESLTANFPNLVSARDRATPSSTLPAPIAPAPESNVSETTTQLQSFGKELGSLREDMKSLADELAQIRKTQAQLLTSQNQLVLETQRLFARSRADNFGRSSTAEKTAKPPKGQKRPYPGIFPPFF